MVPLRT
jgi:guanosine-3',5'-bis(diphosphate) 3'-pyrophosphohydrolase